LNIFVQITVGGAAIVLSCAGIFYIRSRIHQFTAWLCCMKTTGKIKQRPEIIVKYNPTFEPIYNRPASEMYEIPLQDNLDDFDSDFIYESVDIYESIDNIYENADGQQLVSVGVMGGAAAVGGVGAGAGPVAGAGAPMFVNAAPAAFGPGAIATAQPLLRPYQDGQLAAGGQLAIMPGTGTAVLFGGQSAGFGAQPAAFGGQSAAFGGQSAAFAGGQTTAYYIPTPPPMPPANFFAGTAQGVDGAWGLPTATGAAAFLSTDDAGGLPFADGATALSTETNGTPTSNTVPKRFMHAPSGPPPDPPKGKKLPLPKHKPPLGIVENIKGIFAKNNKKKNKSVEQEMIEMEDMGDMEEIDLSDERTPVGLGAVKKAPPIVRQTRGSIARENAIKAKNKKT